MKGKLFIFFMVGMIGAANAVFGVTRMVVCEESYKSL